MRRGCALASEKTDKMAEIDQFLVMIDTKIAALQALRSSYVAALSVGALGQAADQSAVLPPGPVAMTGAPLDLPRGALLGKTIPAAIKLYLATVRQKRTNTEITAAMREGGVESLAGNFDATVAGALHRMKKAGEVLRFDDGWALAEFYPDSFKTRLAESKQPAKRRRKLTGKTKAKTVPSAKAAANKTRNQKAPNRLWHGPSLHRPGLHTNFCLCKGTNYRIRR